MCKPGDDERDVSREASELEARAGMPDRRHAPSSMNGTWKMPLSIVVGIVVGLLMPQVIALTSGSASAETASEMNSREIAALKMRVLATETRQAERGVVTSEKLATSAVDDIIRLANHERADDDRFAKIEAFDAAMGQELKDITSMMVEMARKLNSIEARLIAKDAG